MKILVFSKKAALAGLAAELAAGDRCFYLSDDYRTFVEIRNTLKEPGAILTLRGRFHSAIREIEDDFLRFSHEVNRQNRSMTYWGSQLASRNSATIPLLKYAAYFHCARQCMDEEENRLIFVCDSTALAEILLQESKSRGIECRIIRSPREALLPLQTIAYLLLKGLYFIAMAAARWVYSRTLKNPRLTDQPPLQRVLIRSWVTAGSVDGSGNYRERNFGVLPSFLEENAIDVWTLPMFFNLDRSIFTQLKLMAASSSRFVFPEQYLTLADFWKALFESVRGIRLELNGARFEGRDFSPVLREIHRVESFSLGLIGLNMVTRLLERFHAAGVRIDRILYPIENNAPEKPLVLAARRFYPGARIMAFQHTVWYHEQLGMVIHPVEQDTTPLPDAVVTSGTRYVDVLSSVGFPPEILTAGPNLRYTAVNQTLPEDQAVKTAADGSKRLLVILNFDFNHTLELLEKVGVATQDMGQAEVFIKPHPATPHEDLATFLSDIGFCRYQWAEGTVQDWVLKADAVIMTGGSVSNLEVIALGAPLLRISLDNNFDFDPLWDEYPFCPFLAEPEQISFFLRKAFDISAAEREKLREFGRKLVENYFEPVTPENLRIFL